MQAAARTKSRKKAASKPRQPKAHTKRKTRPPKTVTIKVPPPEGKTTVLTVRLAPTLKQRLDTLHGILKRTHDKGTVNGLVNEAIESYVDRRSAEVTADLSGMIAKLGEYRSRDPKFDRAFATWADAEARSGSDDPVEGRMILRGKAKQSTGPAQKMVRELLNG